MSLLKVYSHNNTCPISFASDVNGQIRVIRGACDRKRVPFKERYIFDIQIYVLTRPIDNLIPPRVIHNYF